MLRALYSSCSSRGCQTSAVSSLAGDASPGSELDGSRLYRDPFGVVKSDVRRARSFISNISLSKCPSQCPSRDTRKVSFGMCPKEGRPGIARIVDAINSASGRVPIPNCQSSSSSDAQQSLLYGIYHGSSLVSIHTAWADQVKPLGLHWLPSAMTMDSGLRVYRMQPDQSNPQLASSQRIPLLVTGLRLDSRL